MKKIGQSVGLFKIITTFASQLREKQLQNILERWQSGRLRRS